MENAVFSLWKEFDFHTKRFHHYGACNKILKAALEERYPKKNVVLLSHGVDTELFKPGPATNEEFTIGWVGRTKRELKRFALAQEIARDMNVRLKVADFYGDGEYEYYDHNDMPNFYRDIDLLLVTSETEARRP